MDANHAQVELRPIPGWEGLYSVSCDGRIWSEPKVRCFQMRPGQWLSPGKDRYGYHMVILSRKDGRKTMPVHRAVALAWVPNPNAHRVLNHINGIASDNRAANLEWCTQAHNVKHAHRTGLNRSRGRIDDVQPVLDALAASELQKEIAVRFKVSQSTISAIKTGTYRPNRYFPPQPGETANEN